MLRIVKIFLNEVEPRENVKAASMQHQQPILALLLPVWVIPSTEGAHHMNSTFCSAKSLLVPGCNLDSGSASLRLLCARGPPQVSSRTISWCRS